MKYCSLLNRIVPQARQSLRNFTNDSAESLGTKLLYGHSGTIGKSVIARRNNPQACSVAQSKKSFLHVQPRKRGKSSCSKSAFTCRAGAGEGRSTVKSLPPVYEGIVCFNHASKRR